MMGSHAGRTSQLILAYLYGTYVGSSVWFPLELKRETTPCRTTRPNENQVRDSEHVEPGVSRLVLASTTGTSTVTSHYQGLVGSYVLSTPTKE
jgi:hypothetical protein